MKNTGVYVCVCVLKTESHTLHCPSTSTPSGSLTSLVQIRVSWSVSGRHVCHCSRSHGQSREKDWIIMSHFKGAVIRYQYDWKCPQEKAVI